MTAIVYIREPKTLLHSVLHNHIGLGGGGCTTCRRGCHADGKCGARGIVLRDRAAVVGRSGDGHIDRSSSVGESHNRIGRATVRCSFGLHLHTCDGYGLVGGRGRARPREVARGIQHEAPALATRLRAARPGGL